MIVVTYGAKSDLNLKLWVKLSRLNMEISRELLKVFKSHGLSTAQFAVLEVLYHKGELSIGEIIEKILISGGNITVVVTNLEKKGLLEQRPDEQDARRKRVQITKAGAELLEIVFQDHLDTLNQLLDYYEDIEKEELIYLLGQIKERREKTQ